MCSCFCATFVCNWDCLILSTFQMDGLDVEIEPELGICELLVASLCHGAFSANVVAWYLLLSMMPREDIGFVPFLQCWTMILMDVSSYCRSASCSLDKLLHEGLEHFVPIVYVVSLSCQGRIIYWFLGCQLCYLVACFVFPVSCSQNLYLLISKRPLVALSLILPGHNKDTCMVLYLLPA